jgi:hypothetical protein
VSGDWWNAMAVARSFLDLVVYQAARGGAQMVFEISKGFPRDERFSLTDQVRRSLRAVGAMLAEAWIDHARVPGFVTEKQFVDHYEKLGGKLSRMMDRTDAFCKNAPDNDYGAVVREEPDDEWYSTNHHSPITTHQP